MLACFARAGACARIGSSLRGRLLPLGPDTRFSQAVGRILGRLESRERFLAARLEQADGRRAQLATTKQLWWAYAKAAKALRRLDSGPADDELRRRLAEGLRLAGCAYGRAADPVDASEYAREGDLALAEQTGVAAALTGLAQAGYTLPPVAAGASRFTQLPRLAA
jgi:hypothetical protein